MTIKNEKLSILNRHLLFFCIDCICSVFVNKNAKKINAFCRPIRVLFDCFIRALLQIKKKLPMRKQTAYFTYLVDFFAIVALVGVM